MVLPRMYPCLWRPWTVLGVLICYKERGQIVSKQHVCSKVEGYLFTQNDTLNYFKLNFLEELNFWYNNTMYIYIYTCMYAE